MAYQKAVVAERQKVEGDVEQRLVDEYLPRWLEKPPDKLTRYTPKPTPADIEGYLRRAAQRLFSDAVEFAPPRVRVVYKNIAPESVRDPAFLKPLQSIMERRRVPDPIIASLFASGDAAPAPGGLTAP